MCETRPKKVPTPAQCSVAAEDVISICKSNWEAHKTNCSGFVKAVAEELGIFLFGQANDIVDYIAADWWPVENGIEARNWAEAGYLVIGGLQATGHGHVVVVTCGPLAHGKYPTAYWGRLGAVGEKAKTINFAWNVTDRDKVRYFAAKTQA
jgi:hypothetical protein